MSKKKNILLIVRWPGGGIRTFIRYVYKNTDKNNWNFTILAPRSDGLELLKKDLSDIGAKFIEVKNIPTDGSSGAFKFSLAIFRTLKINQYNLIHSHGFTAGLCAGIVNYLFNINHIMTPHDTFNENQFLGFKGFYKKKIMQRIFNSIGKIHFISYDARENYLSFLPKISDLDQLHVISSGIEVERFIKEEPRDLRKELKLDESVFLIGFLGRFMSLKGFRYLIDAVEILNKSVNLSRKPLVLTFGEGCFAAREWRDIQSRGLNDFFIGLPFTDNVAGAIKGLDVVAMPSLSETCPLLPMETLVCGTPFIGTDCIGLREVIRNTPAYKVPKADAFALADALLQEMNFSRKDEFMNFNEKAVERYDVKKSSQAIFNMYESLVVNIG